MVCSWTFELITPSLPPVNALANAALATNWTNLPQTQVNAAATHPALNHASANSPLFLPSTVLLPRHRNQQSHYTSPTPWQKLQSVTALSASTDHFFSQKYICNPSNYPLHSYQRSCPSVTSENLYLSHIVKTSEIRTH